MFSALALMFYRIVVGLVFALSATGKALDFSTFHETVSKFRLLPAAWNRVVACVFLGAEFTVVLLMVGGGSALLAGFLLAAGLLAIFSAALVVALLRNEEMACNCFGRARQQISLFDVGRNALLILCSLGGVQALSTPHQAAYGLETILVALIAICFVVLATNLASIIITLWKPFKVG